MSKKEITQKMIDHYEKRTQEHIDRVSVNMSKLAPEFPELSKEILLRGEQHDSSKFKERERIPYIWLTEFYRCKRLNIPFEYPEGIKERVDKAVDFHYEDNRHHPESHKDVNDMSDLDIIEMVADWTAMSQEFKQNNGSAKVWADKNIDKKWKFNKEKKVFIYKVINILDRINDAV